VLVYCVPACTGGVLSVSMHSNDSIIIGGGNKTVSVWINHANVCMYVCVCVYPCMCVCLCVCVVDVLSYVCVCVYVIYMSL